MTLQNPGHQAGLADLGWKPSFNTALSGDDLSSFLPVRVMAVHRGHLSVAGPDLDTLISSYMPDAASDEDYPTVGDWLLIDPQTYRPQRLLPRFSLFKRRAPGTGRGVQLIAANVDTVFIVSSCNQDFNIARLERYLVLAREADVTPVIVLTKADLTEAPEEYANEARRLQPGLLVETVDARNADSIACLAAWCGTGQTVAFLGSSGVGKSTLVNTLTGSEALATQAIREDDAKGRHTTTGRALHRVRQGGWLLDTPGMRELQLTDAASGLEDVFEDIVALGRACRFSDCTHNGEPGCAVWAAIEEGTLEADRLRRWRKLLAEDRHNSETLVERRARDKAFGKKVRTIMKGKRGAKRPGS